MPGKKRRDGGQGCGRTLCDLIYKAVLSGQIPIGENEDDRERALGRCDEGGEDRSGSHRRRR
jgi:hypothetical protein